MIQLRPQQIVFEDAIDPIDRVIDVDRFNAELDAERTDAAFLAEARERAHLSSAGIAGSNHDHD